MRLWTLHPEYLDSPGLVALWREALLAQAVLNGKTRGYVHHPQLLRFRSALSPMGAIACYLQIVHAEAVRRGFNFDATKLTAVGHIEPIATSIGQLDFEWDHLKTKLQIRAPSWLLNFESISRPKAHSLFRIVPGTIESWEVKK